MEAHVIEFLCQVMGSKEGFKVQMYPLPYPGSTIRLKGGKMYAVMGYLHDCEKNKVVCTVKEIQLPGAIKLPNKIIQN